MSGIGILMLAAGASTRLGQPKQLLPFGNKTLIRQMAEVAIATGCQPVGIVLGAYTKTIEPHLADLNVQVILNEHWETGMASSIQCGLQGLLAIIPDLEAIVLMVCDQPFVSTDLIRQLISGYQTSNASIVASAYADTLGVPALFHRTLFPELFALQGEVGAKSIIGCDRSRCLTVPFAQGAIDLDIPQHTEILSSFVL